MAFVNDLPAENTIYKINSDLLFAQADEIRTLNGTTANMKPSEMITALQSANSEVADQEAKLIEIAELLQGKAMGGSGASVETCTVTITEQSGVHCKYNYTSFDNGAITAHDSTEFYRATVTVENVVCGSTITVMYNTTIPGISTSGGGEPLGDHSVSGWRVLSFAAPTTANATYAITLYDEE